MNEQSRYIKIFRDEALEHLDAFRTGLVQLESANEPPPETLQGILRCAHTIKGSARMVGLSEIGALAHKMEDRLKAVEKGEAQLTTDTVNLMLESADAIREAVDALAAGNEPADLRALVERVGGGEDAAPPPPPEKPEPAAEPPAAKDRRGVLSELAGILGGSGEASPESPAAPPAAETAPASAGRTPSSPPEEEKKKPLSSPETALTRETIRVDVANLDQLTDLSGELVINRIRLENKYFMVKDLFENLGLRVENRASSPEKTEEEWLAEIQTWLRDEMKGRLEELARGIQEMDALAAELQSLTLDLRLLPVSTIFDAYHRTVRDLKQALDKKAALHLSGRDTLIDKRVLEEINPALVHLIRNAVDHGIETPAERRKAGKTEEGRIELEASQEGGNVVVRVSDDGRGMDAGEIREKAVEKGLISREEADDLPDREALNLMFRYGFSTSPIITDVSGRGVGLNVVWEKVEQLKGNINVETDPGRSSAVSLSFPPTYFTLTALVVKTGTEIVALPSNFLAETTWVEPPEVSVEGGRPVVYKQDRFCPLIDLRRFLGFPLDGQPEASSRIPVVVTRFRNKHLALKVDQILRIEEEVVKSTGPFLQNHPFVSGVTILRKGEPCFILNMYDVFKYARNWREEAAAFAGSEERGPGARILVADDSVTTRTLEKSILENAGFTVATARDGREAFEIAQAETFDLIVTDVEMPGMNGFDLTEALRRDLRYREVPVVIVTSLAREEDRRKGIEVGAQAYIVKGTFDQTRLLDTVRSLIP